LDDGAVKPKDMSFKDLGAIVNPVIVGVARFTVKFALMVADEYPNVASCVAVITA
jgi:hypothetical protein